MYSRELIITIPTSHKNIRVLDNESGDYLECELVEENSNMYSLYVLIKINGLTLKTFTLEYSDEMDLEFQAKILEKIRFDSTTTEFDTSYYTLLLSNNTLIKAIKPKKEGKNYEFESRV